jgi:hypothetical protein
MEVRMECCQRGFASQASIRRHWRSLEGGLLDDYPRAATFFMQVNECQIPLGRESWTRKLKGHRVHSACQNWSLRVAGG